MELKRLISESPVVNAIFAVALSPEQRTPRVRDRDGRNLRSGGNETPPRSQSERSYRNPGQVVADPPSCRTALEVDRQERPARGDGESLRRDRLIGTTPEKLLLRARGLSHFDLVASVGVQRGSAAQTPRSLRGRA